MSEQQELELIGKSSNFTKSLEFARNIAVTRSPVLLIGEAGVGKRTFCQFIHQNSARKDQCFQVVDCLRPAKDVQNDLLGYRDDETGAFHRGHFETAHGGTVVLANIEGID